MKTQTVMNLRFSFLTLLLALLLSLDSGSLFAQTTNWFTGFGNASRNDQVSQMTNDPWGNVYVNGVFRDNTNFINLNLNNPIEKGYIGRLQDDGNFAWVNEVDSIRYANAMAADGFGNIYLAGYGIDFTYRRQILVQLDSSGNYVGSRRIEGCEIYDVEVDANGDIFITGNMGDHLIVDGDTVLTNPVPTNNVLVSGFILKYDPANNVAAWGEVAYTNAGATGFVAGARLAVDGGGNVFMTGRFHSDSLRLGGTATGYMLLPQTWQANSFLARFDASGSIQWVETSVFADFGEIAADANGNLYCSGSAQGYNTNGVVYFMDTTYSVPTNLFQPFIAKVDANGQRIGFHNEQAVPSIGAKRIALNTAGEPIIGNQFYGNITIMGTALQSPNIQSSYLQKFSTDLTPQWVKFCEGVNNPSNPPYGVQINGLGIDLYGNYYFGGGYQGQANLDNLTITSLSTDPNDSLDSWVGHIYDQAFTLPTDSVWPGDTDYDGVANNVDLLPIGLAYGTVGLNRPNASLAWQGQPAPNWFQSLPAGANYKHIDTDGDGIIGDSDTLAISQNYGQMHLRGTEGDTGIPIYLSFTEDTIFAGDTATLLINLGQDTMPANNIYGLAFSISYDSSLVDPTSFQVDYDQSWLGSLGSNMLKLEKNFPDNEQLDMALTRLDQQNQSGFGEIARIRLIMVDDLTAKADLAEALAMDIGNIYAISADGSTVDLVGQGDSTIVFQEDTTSSTAIQPDWYQQIQLYPNPTADDIQISLDGLTAQSLALYDLEGRLLKTTDVAFRQQKLSLTNLPAGVYTLRLQTDKGWYQERIMKK
ncbi:MAG: T9SS type A sorting domain-containing protein [Bacteroidota bacterium]